jgi:hypothetical protein
LGSSRDLEHRAEAWRPWRAYAAMYLWRISGQPDTRAIKLVSHPTRNQTVESTGSRISLVV